MAEQETPTLDRADKERARQQERESAAPRGRQLGERASRGDLGDHDAARRQARQDPLQHRDR